MTLGGPGHLRDKIDLDSPCCLFSEFVYVACYCFAQCLVQPDPVWPVVTVANSSVWGLPHSGAGYYGQATILGRVVVWASYCIEQKDGLGKLLQ